MEERKNSEKFYGIAETVAYAFEAFFENFVGGTVFLFREHIKEIAAPEPESKIQAA